MEQNLAKPYEVYFLPFEQKQKKQKGLALVSICKQIDFLQKIPENNKL